MVLKLNIEYIKLKERDENNRVKRQSIPCIQEYFQLLLKTTDWQINYQKNDACSLFSSDYLDVINRLNAEEFRKFKRIAEKNVKKGAISEPDDVFLRKPRITDYFQ